MSVCTRFLAASGKTVRDIFIKFSGCVDTSGGCVLLHFSGVQSARGTCCEAPPKSGFLGPAGHMMRRRCIKLCEKMDAIGGYVLFVVATVRGA